MRALALTLISTAIAFGPLSASVSHAASVTGVDGIAPAHYGYIKRTGTPRALTDAKWTPARKQAFKEMNQINLNEIKQPGDTLNASLEVNKRSELIAW